MSRLLSVLVLVLVLPTTAVATTRKLPLGVNLSGMNSTPGEQWPVPQAVDYYFVQKGMKIARLNLMWELMQPALGQPLMPAQVTGITDQINRLTAAGATMVIIEPHIFGRRTVAGAERIIGEAPEVTAAQFADFCGRVGAQWKGYPTAVFEPMNEPHDQDATKLVATLNGCIAAYREAGAKGLVIVPSNDWGVYGWRPGQPNLVKMLNVVDPLNNLAQDIHWYPDPWGAGQKPEVVEEKLWLEGLVSAQAWARQNGRKLFLGEFATPEGPAGDKTLRRLLTVLNANVDVWIGATWWGAGGWWSHDYIYLLDPYGSKWDPNNPQAREAETWEPRRDKPQMRILEEFAR